MSDIKKARLAKGWSQIEAARRIGVSALTFQLWERGAGKPNPENRKKLEKILDLNKKEEG